MKCALVAALKYLKGKTNVPFSSSPNSSGCSTPIDKKEKALYISLRSAVWDHVSTQLLNYLMSCSVTYGTTSAASTPEDPLRDLHPESPLPVIIRASNGKWKEEKPDKIKLSTIVQPDGLESFYIRYAEICKVGMQALKKRDRSKRKKDKAKKRKGAGAGEGDKKG